MNRTFTRELGAGTLRRLEEYAAHFADDFNRPRQRAWCGVYIAGLLQDGECKSIEPISRRVTLPDVLAGTQDPDQGLQQFVSQSTWDERMVAGRYRALVAKSFADPAGVFVLDDTTFPKAGHVPLALRLFLPGSLVGSARTVGQGGRARGPVAASTSRRKVTWREGTKGPMAGRFAWLRVWPAHGWATGDCAHEEPLWLLVEEQPDGTLKYAFSNLPTDPTRLRAVRLWRERWKIEQGYQQMKEELGLDHFEGRSWRGFHHHAALVMLAFGFLALEQRRAKTRPPPKKSLPSRPA